MAMLPQSGRPTPRGFGKRTPLQRVTRRSGLTSTLIGGARNMIDGIRAAAPSSERARLKESNNQAQEMGGAGHFEMKRGAARVQAPVTSSLVVPGFHVTARGSPQRLTDESGGTGSLGDSLRISGSDQLFSVQSGATLPLALINGTNAGAPGTYYLEVSPAKLGSRLQNMVRNYQWYAIRSLTIRYVPLCGSSIAGAVSLGWASSYDTSLDASINTTGEVMQLTPSVMGPVWNPLSINVKFNGTKLWSTSIISGQPREWIQGLVFCVGNSTVVNGGYGVVTVDYVVDCYGSTPPMVSPSDPKAAEERKTASMAVPSLVREDYGSAYGAAAGAGEFVRTPVATAAPPPTFRR